MSGLAVASAEVMIGSSLNDPGAKAIPAASRCQKPYSGYITLITEWREEILHKPKDSVIRIFPFEYPPPPTEPPTEPPAEPPAEPEPKPEADELGPVKRPGVEVHVEGYQPAEGQTAPEAMGGP